MGAPSWARIGFLTRIGLWTRIDFCAMSESGEGSRPAHPGVRTGCVDPVLKGHASAVPSKPHKERGFSL
jgi:hypothetical protein